MKAKVVEGDLLDQDVDVIVNSWNRNFIPWRILLPQGVSGAIKKRAGYEPFKEVQRYGLLPLGGAALTSAGKLPHKAIIHVAGLHAYWLSSEKAIRLSVRNAMDMASEYNYRSIAFPLVGAGSGGMKEEKAEAIIKDELDKLNYDIDVRIVRFRKIDKSVSGGARAPEQQSAADAQNTAGPAVAEDNQRTPLADKYRPENRNDQLTR